MNSNGGYTSNYAKNNNQGFQGGGGIYSNNQGNYNHTNTYSENNPYPNLSILPKNNQNINKPYQHSNTFMPPQAPGYPPKPYPNPNMNPPKYPPQPPLQKVNTYMPPYPAPMPPYPHQAPPPMPIQPIPPPMDPYTKVRTFNPPIPNMIPPPIAPIIQVPPAPPVPPMNPILPVPPPSNFNPELDCQILRNAVHGAGTDEKAIINIIKSRTLPQRLEIRQKYKALYGKDLIKRLKDDTSGNFKDVIAGMFMSHAEYDAMCLYKAMKGLGTNEGVLIEIIGTRTNMELQLVKEAFQREYKESLEKWVKGDTSGNFRKCLIALLQCDRSMNPHPDPNMCEVDAQTLYKAGEGRLGTDEATFIRIFSSRSPAELTMINSCYTRLRGKDLFHAVDGEFSGDIKKLLNTVLFAMMDMPGYFATRIREAVKGLGTNDSKLVRVIVSRNDIDMEEIKLAYHRLFGRDMIADVSSDTSGDYRNILVGILYR